MLPNADQAMQRDILTGTRLLSVFPTLLGRRPRDHDRFAAMVETVISGYGLGMLRNHQRGLMVTRFA
jgi:hypothetical protein